MLQKLRVSIQEHLHRVREPQPARGVDGSDPHGPGQRPDVRPVLDQHPRHGL